MKLMDDSFLAAGQIATSDLPEIANAGVKLIICARPDDEDEGQPSASELRQEAAKLGIELVQVPLVPGQLTYDHVTDFSSALKSASCKTLGYCRTGTRATLLWAIYEVANGEELETVLERAEQAGTSVAKYENLIEAMALKLENE